MKVGRIVLTERPSRVNHLAMRYLIWRSATGANHFTRSSAVIRFPISTQRHMEYHLFSAMPYGGLASMSD
jgi:hypothetical protein